MNLEEAIKILKHVGLKHETWGKHYNVAQDSQYDGFTITEAIVQVMENAQFDSEDLKEKAKDLSKQLRAAKAREGKLKKKIEKMELQFEEQYTDMVALENDKIQLLDDIDRLEYQLAELQDIT